MQRECDIRVKLKMSSVMYLHTQRFALEITQFVQEFNQLRYIVSRWRATSAGLEVADYSRGSRVSLDISAGSPVIFMPMSSCSETLMVADLGSLTISNKFLWAGSKGTISQVQRQNLEERLRGQQGAPSTRSSSRSLDPRSRSRSRHRETGLSFPSDSDAEGDQRQQTVTSDSSKLQKCLLDVMYIDLVNMDIYTSIRLSKEMSFNSKVREKEQPSTFAEKEKQEPSKSKESSSSGENVEWIFGSYSVMRQGVSMLQEKCAFKLQVERNLDTALSHAVADISVHGMMKKVHATIDTLNYKLIRGLLLYNLGEPLPSLPAHLYHSQPQEPWPTPECVWTSLNIILNLDNVTLEIESVQEGSAQAKSCTPLVCVNFISSKLTYESFSDGSKDVDLVSQEILLSDTRFEGFPVNKRSNIFTNILQPTPSKSAKKCSQLQAEVHFSPSQKIPMRTRKPRLVIGLNGMIPRYSASQAAGQELLLSFDQGGTEIFLGCEVLREGGEDLRVIISSEQVQVFSQSEPSSTPTPVLTVYYRDLYQCKPVVLQVEGSETDHKHYIELSLKAEKSETPGIPRPSDLAYKRPKVRCDSRSIACRVAQQINYARNLHDELRQTLLNQEEENIDD